MDALLASALAFPTVIFTILLGIILLYWLTVIAGIFDLDALDSVGGAADAKAGMFDGAAEAIEGKAGMLDGAAEAIEAKAGIFGGAAEAIEGKAGMLDGAAEAVDAKAGAFDAMADGVDAKFGASEAASAASAKGRVPVTIRASLFVVAAWFTSYVFVYNLSTDPASATLPVRLGAFGAAVVAGWILARVGSLPLAPLFRVKRAPKNSELIGKVCTITTGRVDEHFGQAQADDGGAGLVIQVRCEPGQLARNDEAMIVAWDEAEYAFTVTPLDAILR